MNKLTTIIFFVLLSCFAGTLHINFNDGTLTEDIDFAEIVNMQIVDSTMVFVQGGTFEMGSSDGDTDELPVHSVTLGDFFIGKYEITQSEWAEYMPTRAYNYGRGDNYPVYDVSYYDILIYCNKRSNAEGITPCYNIGGSIDPDDWGAIPQEIDSIWDAVECNWAANGYRMPTEAEWEYAARGGIYWNDHYQYSGNDSIDYVAWYLGNFNDPTYGCKQVGTKLPNQLGIYDMTGNVWERVWDWYSNTYYSTSPEDNPHGPESGSVTICRGGCWEIDALYCRNANRARGDTWGISYRVGFRIARSK